jgi:hypothetical protein
MLFKPSCMAELVGELGQPDSLSSITRRLMISVCLDALEKLV